MLEANGHPLRDVIDWAFYADGRSVLLRVARGAEAFSVRLRRPAGVGWGIEFAEPLFDGVRRCQNRCLFCFLDQLPQGWRPSIYLRDDDYRLSFLFGNFVTLTNLCEEDWHRLEKQRLSPLYVSVHATEPLLRQRLLGRERIPDIREQLERLGRLGIVVHTQVVLCPGINDGAYLERTVEDLARLSPPVASVALVPVGLTRFRRPAQQGTTEPLRLYTSDEAQALWRWVRSCQRTFRALLGRTFLHLADEFYLLAGRPVPRAAWYDGFPQAENGVGLLRRLLDDWARVRRRSPPQLGRRVQITLVSGTLIAPTLRRIASTEEKRVEGLEVQLLPLENRTFGPMVTVSGLLTGETFLQGLSAARGEIVFLPRAAFGSEGKETLDGLLLEELRERLDRPVVLVERWSEVLKALRGGFPDAGSRTEALHLSHGGMPSG